MADEKERDLQFELDQLKIVSFDANGATTKSDIFKALDAIRHSIEKTPDSEKKKLIAAIKG